MAVKTGNTSHFEICVGCVMDTDYSICDSRYKICGWKKMLKELKENLPEQ